jgi:hypothetical protein
VAGLLRPAVVLPLVVAVGLAGWRSWRELAAAVRQVRPRFPAASALPAVLVLPGIVLAFYPSLDFDATMYHLPFARAFAATGRLPFLADLRFPVFPQLVEVLFAIVHPAGADIAAQCVSLSMTLLTALLLASWGALEGAPAAGWVAAAALLGQPIVAYFGATAYIEPGLMLLATAAFFAYRRFVATEAIAGIALAGFFAGTSADAKYLGLVIVALLGAAAVVCGLVQKRAGPPFLFAGAAAAAMAPWYGRIFLRTGNPVFPYFARLFGKSAWDLSGYQPRWGGVADLLSRAATAPYDLLWPTRRFDWHPPFSPFGLVAAPLLLFAVVRCRGWRALVAVGGLYSLFALTLPRDPRYLMPVLPLFSLAAVLVVAAAVRQWFSRATRSGSEPRARAAAAALAAVLLLPSALYSARLVKRRGPPPVTAAGAERYRAHLPLYRAVEFLNRTRDSRYSVYAFDSENMAYFARGRFRGDWFGPAAYAPMREAAASPETLWTALHGIGADCLMFAAWRPPHLDSPEFARYFVPLYADRYARVYEVRSPPR